MFITDEALALLKKKRVQLLLAVITLAFLVDATKEIWLTRVVKPHAQVVAKAQQSAESNHRILARTGPILLGQSEFNTFLLRPDSLRFTISLSGEKGTVTIQASAVEQTSGNWLISHSDTIFTRSNSQK